MNTTTNDCVPDLKTTLTEINRTFNLTADQLAAFCGDLFAIARSTSQSFDAAANAAQVFSRQGLPISSTLDRTKDALTFVRLSGTQSAQPVVLTYTLEPHGDLAAQLQTQLEAAVRKVVSKWEGTPIRA